MKNIIGLILIYTLFFMTFKPVFAADLSIAGNSASINHHVLAIRKDNNQDLLLKRKVIKNVLERYNSPLVSDVDSFIVASQQYNLDPYLLPSIMGVESYFGQMIYPGTFNGFGWGGGMIYFKNWNDGIMTVGKGLRENYFNKGATNVYDIAHIYAPPSTTWGAHVTYFMDQFYAEENQLQSSSLPL